MITVVRNVISKANGTNSTEETEEHFLEKVGGEGAAALLVSSFCYGAPSSYFLSFFLLELQTAVSDKLKTYTFLDTNDTL
jgi:hypothetical protein